jgi:hypothetical protein
MDLRPGWCRGPEGAALCPPHTLRCRGSGVPQEMGARSALNGERGALRSRRSIPIQTYPEWILGIDGWATRTGQRGSALAACSESGVGDGVVSTPSSPAAGDRANGRPGCRCPTGAALRPTNKRGVSSGNRWLGREPPGSRGQPEGVAQEGRRKLKLLAARIARVRSCGWDTRYGEQNASVRVLPATPWPS